MEKVLIIEDDKDIAELVRYNLKKKGFEVIEAYDGKFGLNLAKTQNPDLVLLDLMLPKMDGYEVLRFMKEDRNISRIPVIIISAKVSPGAIIKGFGYGAIDYVPKPFNIGELTSKVYAAIKESNKKGE